MTLKLGQFDETKVLLLQAKNKSSFNSTRSGFSPRPKIVGLLWFAIFGDLTSMLWARHFSLHQHRQLWGFSASLLKIVTIN